MEILVFTNTNRKPKRKIYTLILRLLKCLASHGVIEETFLWMQAKARGNLIWILKFPEFSSTSFLQVL